MSLPLIYKIFERFAVHRVNVISTLLPKKSELILDIGCNTGSFLINNKEKFNLGVGIDVVQELLDEAIIKSKSNKIRFLKIDLGCNPFPFNSGQVSTITIIATLQYLLDLDVVFSEVQRVLKPGGILIFEVPNFLVFWRRLQMFFGILPATSQFQHGWNGGVIHYFSEQKLTPFVEEKGFIVRKITCSGVFSKARSVHPGLLGANLIYVCQKK